MAGDTMRGVERRLVKPVGLSWQGWLLEGWRCGWLFGLLLLLVTFIVYLPAMRGELIWDDASWTTGISTLLRDFSGLWTMWFKPGALQQYYPLAGTSFWLDYHLWGFRTLPYHIENVLLHVLAALLFWKLLERLKVPGARLAAAVFALHPLMVESVGWLTERKNVLSLSLYLGAALAYGRWVNFWEDTPGNPSTNRAQQWHPYILALALFLSSLLAKTTAFSFPAVLLLLCWWKRGRIRWRADVLPTLPFFALAIGLGVLVTWLEKHSVGAKGPEWALSFGQRCLIAGRALCFYTGKIFWPADLCFMYPRWQPDTKSFAQWLCPAAAVALPIVFWLARARVGRGPLTAWLFFVGTLLPLLGFIDGYFMRYSFVCDHWAYLSSLGLIGLGAAAVVSFMRRVRDPAILYVGAVAYLCVLGLLTWRQSGFYRDAETLWRATLQVNPNAFVAHSNLGYILSQKGDLDGAITHYGKAIEIDPRLAEAEYSLAVTLIQAGRPGEARAHFEHVLKVRPDSAVANCKLGVLLLQQGLVDEAINHLRAALQLRPAYPEACFDLATALARKGQAEEAISLLQKAVELQPGLTQGHYNLGVLLLQKGQDDPAITQFQQALNSNPDYFPALMKLSEALVRKGRAPEAIAACERVLTIRPDMAEVHGSLGYLLLRQGKSEEAIRHCQAAIAAQPNNPGFLNNLAWIRATHAEAQMRNGPEAVQLADRACQITQHKQPTFLVTLAAAYAEAGRFEDAVAEAEQARALASNLGQTNVADKCAQMREIFAAHKAYREQ